MITVFIIFAAIWTLAILLFIIAMIAIDLATIKKAGQSEEQTIDIGDTANASDGFSTKNVVEDPNTGGFSFITPSSTTNVQSEIAEADETNDSEESDDSKEQTSEEAENNAEDNSPAPSDESDSDEQQTDSESESEADDDDNENVNENPNDDTIAGIMTVDMDDAILPQPKETKPFSENEAFDPSLRQTHYDVKDMYEPSVSPEVKSHADTVNESMEHINTHSTSYTSKELREVMRNRLRENQKIELRDECNKF